MRKTMTVYISPLEMDSTKGRLIDLPMEQDALETLLCEMGTDVPLYVEASDYCGRSYLAGHLPEEMELAEWNLLACKLADLSPYQEIAFEGLVRMDLDKGVAELPLIRMHRYVPFPGP